MNARGIVLIGCGFMGKALLEGWLSCGIAPNVITVQDPQPSDWLQAQQGMRVNAPLPDDPALVIVATKPQLLDAVLPDLQRFGAGTTVFVSIAAGAPVSLFESHLGMSTPIVRAMPNLPASVGAGVTALFATAATNDIQLALVEAMFEVVGSVVNVPDEEKLHSVTALSGSGPAYVFALAEALGQAGMDLGLDPALARTLAVKTLAGAGAMLQAPDADATALRMAVTSKGGTTAAGLSEFMAEQTGIGPLTIRTVNAARQRSIDLAEL